MIIQEQWIVRQWWHCNANLSQIIKILENRHFTQQQTVWYVFRHQKSAHQMLHRSSFTTMRSKYKCIHATFPKTKHTNLMIKFLKAEKVKWKLTFWNDSTPSYLHTCSKYNMHMADYLQRSSLRAVKRHVQIVDFRASIHHRHCQTQ